MSESDRPQLIVVAFKGDIFKAGEVLHELTLLDEEWAVNLSDAVAVYRDHNGELKVDQSYQMTTRQEAGWGACLGILVGALIAIPFTAGASGAAAVGVLASTTLGGVLGAAGGALDAGSWKEVFGIPEEFVNTAASTIQIHDSAILALLHVVDPEKITEELRGRGGKLLQTTLGSQQAAKLQALLDGRDVRQPEGARGKGYQR